VRAQILLTSANPCCGVRPLDQIGRTGSHRGLSGSAGGLRLTKKSPLPAQAIGASDPLPSGPVKVGLLNRQSTLGSGNRATLYALIGPLPPRASNGEVGLKPAFADSQYGDVSRKASRLALASTVRSLSPLRSAPSQSSGTRRVSSTSPSSRMNRPADSRPFHVFDCHIANHSPPITRKPNP